MRIVSETSGTILKAPTFDLYGSQKKKKEGSKKNFEALIGENSSNMGKEIVKGKSPRGIKSPIQDKPKEKHAKTHANQTKKD